MPWSKAPLFTDSVWRCAAASCGANANYPIGTAWGDLSANYSCRCQDIWLFRHFMIGRHVGSLLFAAITLQFDPDGPLSDDMRIGPRSKRARIRFPSGG
jgi:hypothetical protein